MPFQPPGKLHQHLPDLRVNGQPAVDLLHQLCNLLPALGPKLVPVLRLLLIDTVQVLGENIFSELGTQIMHTLFREIPFVLHRGIRQEMDVRMVALVVERREPLEVFHGYFEVFSQCLGLSAQHIPPAGAIIKAQALRVFTPERYYNGIHVAAVAVLLRQSVLRYQWLTCS